MLDEAQKRLKLVTELNTIDANIVTAESRVELANAARPYYARDIAKLRRSRPGEKKR